MSAIAGQNLAQASSPAGAANWIATGAAILGVFMAVMDTQVTNASLHEIRGALSATQEEVSWITTSYLSAEVVAIPLTAYFTRVFGTRTYMVANSFAFLLASTLCGHAWNLASMAAFRALQGFTGGALIPTAMTLVLTELPATRRTAGLALLMLASTLAPSFGPTLGGFLTDRYGWPSIFFINWIPGLLMLAGLAFGLRREPMRLSMLAETDWPAIACVAVGLGALIVFLEKGNAQDWFESGFIRSAFAVAVVALGGGIAILLRRRDPFVKLTLFARRSFGLSALAGAAAGMGLYGSTFVLPLFLAEIAGYSTLRIGEVIMWMGLPQIVMMPVAAILTKRFDNRHVCSAGFALFAASCFLNAGMDATTGYDQLLASQILRALGQPLVVLALSNFAVHRIARSDLSSASSLYNMSRILGGAVGTAVLATFITLREHFHSARIGEFVTLLSAATRERIAALTAQLVATGSDPVAAHALAIGAIDARIRREAYVLAYDDAFFLIGCVLLATIPLIQLAGRVVPPSD